MRAMQRAEAFASRKPIRAFLRVMKASRLFGQASKLTERACYQDAGQVLKVVLDLVPPMRGAWFGPLFVRLTREH